MTKLRSLEKLPRKTATQVKNKWGEVVRQVQQHGSVAVTSHSSVEMVLLDVATYQQLVDNEAARVSHEQQVLDELTSRFDTRLAELRTPGARDKVAAVFTARGKLVRRPKAGQSF